MSASAEAHAMTRYGLLGRFAASGARALLGRSDEPTVLVGNAQTILFRRAFSNLLDYSEFFP